MKENKPKLTKNEIQEWFKARLIELLDIEADEVDVTLPFDTYNLDSHMAIGLTSDLEELLGNDLEPTLLYQYPTIEKISQHLATSQESG